MRNAWITLFMRSVKCERTRALTPLIRASLSFSLGWYVFFCDTSACNSFSGIDWNFYVFFCIQLSWLYSYLVETQRNHARDFNDRNDLFIQNLLFFFNLKWQSNKGHHILLSHSHYTFYIVIHWIIENWLSSRIISETNRNQTEHLFSIKIFSFHA